MPIDIDLKKEAMTDIFGVTFNFPADDTGGVVIAELSADGCATTCIDAPLAAALQNGTAVA